MDGEHITLVIEKRQLAREGLIRLLPKGKFRVIAAASSCEELAPDQLPIQPDLLLLGATGCPESTASEVKRFRHVWPEAYVVVVSDGHYCEEIANALEAGAHGVVSQSASPLVLIKTLELVLTGAIVLCSHMLPAIMVKPHGPVAGALNGPERLSRPNSGLDPVRTENDLELAHLSVREKLILSMLSSGNSNKLIARQLNVAEATVKVHVKSILRKIRVQNRTQAAIWAKERGLDAVPPSAELQPASVVSIR